MNFISVAIINSIALICFTFLAYKFGHWWISLFSLLFMMTTRRKDSESKDENKEEME